MNQAKSEIRRIALERGMKVYSPRYGHGEIDYYLERGHKVAVWFYSIEEIRRTSLQTCKLWRYRYIHKKWGVLTRDGVLII
jgi:hypothetical protein